MKLVKFHEHLVTYRYNTYLWNVLVLNQAIQTAPQSRNLGSTTSSEASAAPTILHPSEFFQQSEGYPEFVNSTLVSGTASMAGVMHQTATTQPQPENEHPSPADQDIWRSSGFIAMRVDINKAGEYTCEVCNVFACQHHGIFIDENGKMIGCVNNTRMPLRCK